MQGVKIIPELAEPYGLVKRMIVSASGEALNLTSSVSSSSVFAPSSDTEASSVALSKSSSLSSSSSSAKAKPWRPVKTHN
jgi:hypothetical protein